MLYATGLRGAPNTDLANDLASGAFNRANVAESITIEARLQNGLVYQLAVEYAGAAFDGAAGVDQVNFILPHTLQGAGEVELTLVAGGQRSNAGTIIVR
jgi:uncharacterized protein (TIGR03437 family)